MEISDTVGQDFNRSLIRQASSWAWSYGSWIYNYLCNQCLSSPMLWAWISIRARCTTLCDKVCQWLRQVGGFLPVLSNLSLLMIENMTWVQAFLVQTQLTIIRHHLYGSMTWHHWKLKYIWIHFCIIFWWCMSSIIKQCQKHRKKNL
jgi:hypothetical protein